MITLMLVIKSTYALSVAYQDIRAGNDTRCSSSQFKAYNPLQKKKNLNLIGSLSIIRAKICPHLNDWVGQC